MSREVIELKESHIENMKIKMKDQNISFLMECLNGMIEIEPEESFDLTGEIIPLSYLDVKPVSFFFDDDDLEEDKNDPQFLKDRINDYMHEIAYDETPSEFLLDRDDDKELYLDSKGHKANFEIIGEQVVMSKISYLDFRGEAYNSILKNVDMSKFIKRNYKKEENYKPLEDNDGISSKPIVAMTLSDDTPHLILEIDNRLFRRWVICEFMKVLFECTYDPFFERDGLIHQKGRGYGEHAPKFKMPKNLDYKSLVDSLILSREHMSNENLLTIR